MDESTNPGFVQTAFRHVPLSLRIGALFGGFMSQFGWAFFGFGLIFFWVFGYNADLSSFTYFRNPGTYVAGKVIEVTATSASEGEQRVFEIAYEFQVDSTGNKTSPEAVPASFKGISFANSPNLNAGDKVEVEYVPDNPSISRIKGFRRKMFGPAALFVVIFPLIGLPFLIFGFLRGLKVNRLYSFSRIAKGKLASKSPTNTRINNRIVYEMTFQFTAEDGRTYSVAERTHEPELLEDEKEETLIYDPTCPSEAVMLDSLPGSPRVDGNGNYIAADSSTWLNLILPTLVILINLPIAAYFLTH